MKLYIKNMVCDRCKMVVESQLKQLKYTPLTVELGVVEIKEDQLGKNKELLTHSLQQLGFEFLENEKNLLVQQVKSSIIEHLQQDDVLETNLSDFIAKKLGKNYASISAAFKEAEGNTLEKFYIRQRIEKAKELLSYGELNMNEIAYRLHYSSVAHLSSQFKQVTGIAPSDYKKQNKLGRIPLDHI